jgi:glycosyltransferase involved in cell wall biosynthesis
VRTPPAGDGCRVIRIPDHGLFGWPGALERLLEKPWRSAGALAFVRGARRALSEHGPFQRVVAHWIVPSGFPVALASGGAELEVVAHGSDVRLLLRLPRIARLFIVERLLASGARFRFVSHTLRDELVRATTLALGRASVVAASPIDLDSAPSRRVARERLGLAPGDRLAVIAGRLVASKRTQVALQALCLVPDLSVVVVGDGPERGKLERSFERVTFVGQLPRPDALSFIAAADVVVSASQSEGAPSVVREARGLGVPVVACDSGDLRAWAERDSGLVVVSQMSGRRFACEERRPTAENRSSIAQTRPMPELRGLLRNEHPPRSGE